MSRSNSNYYGQSSSSYQPPRPRSCSPVNPTITPNSCPGDEMFISALLDSSNESSQQPQSDDKYQALRGARLPEPCPFNTKEEYILQSNKVIHISSNFKDLLQWSLKAGVHYDAVKRAFRIKRMKDDTAIKLMLADWFQASRIERNVTDEDVGKLNLATANNDSLKEDITNRIAEITEASQRDS